MTTFDNFNHWGFQISFAICDLGLSIIKRLARKEDDFRGFTASISLPSMLYKTKEKKGGEDSVVCSKLLPEICTLVTQFNVYFTK